MKELFTKNDRYLHVTKFLFIIFIVLFGLGSLVGGIVLMALEIVGAGIGLLFGGLILTFISYVFGRLLFSYLVDIKAIRNKLYNCDNDELNRFYRIQDFSGETIFAVDTPDTAKRLADLKAAYDCGALTKEEYDEQKLKIMNESDT